MRQAGLLFRWQGLTAKPAGAGLRFAGTSARCDVEGLVNSLRNRLDLRSEFLFNAVEVEAIFVGNEVDGETKVTESSGTTDTVKVGFRVLGEVEVDDNVDGLNVDTASK